ncbi:MAG: hypothetical protein HOI69_04610 [Gammaproteobacteria bacterium]|jgi:hypothetical protein|nr:hypothetical protein [Gammaproteobacteria bacterium]
MTTLIKAWAKFTIAGRIPIIAGSVLLLLIVLLTGNAIPFDNSTKRYFVVTYPPILEP